MGHELVVNHLLPFFFLHPEPFFFFKKKKKNPQQQSAQHNLECKRHT
jgi:hypothetical protein